MFDPWTIVSANTWIQVHHVLMPDGKPGATNGIDTIWLDERLTARERRCVLTHELIHLQYGHKDCQQPKTERRVRTETAHLLIPWTTLVDSALGHISMSELAEELHVTTQVIEDRFHAMSPVEIELLQSRGATIGTDATW